MSETKKNLSAINLIKFVAGHPGDHSELCKDWLEDQNAIDRCELIEDEFFDWKWLDLK